MDKNGIETRVPLIFGYTTIQKLLEELIPILEVKNGRKFEEKERKRECKLCKKEFNMDEFYYMAGKRSNYCKDCYKKKYNKGTGLGRKPKMKL